MSDIVTERSGSILRIQLNRPARKNAMDVSDVPHHRGPACKRLMRESVRQELAGAVKLENEEFSSRVRSADAKEAFTAFIQKCPPNFSRTKQTANAG